jgi:hypothetical protein
MATVGIDKYLNDILAKIYDDQEICKLLLYDDVNPLSHADISDTTVLRTNKNNQRIFVTPFIIETADKVKTTLHIMLNDFGIDEKNMFYEDMTIDFIISCNVRIWELNDGSGDVKLRVNGIWDRLSHLFKRQNTVGVGKNHFMYGKVSKFSDYFWGYTYCLSSKNLPIYDS